MRFANSRAQREWGNPRLNPFLKSIIYDVSTYAVSRWGWEFMVTSIWRSPEEEADLKASGVHGHWRGLDVRTKDQNPQAVKDITAYTNGKWVYDPSRPKLLVCFSEPHGTGLHAHFQVHPNTRLRGLRP